MGKPGKRKPPCKPCVVCGHRRYCHLSPTGCWKTYNDSLRPDPITTLREITIPMSTRDLFANTDMEGVRSAAE